MTRVIVLSLLLVGFLIGGSPSWNAMSGESWAQTAQPAGAGMKIVGRIVQVDSSYYVQGETPREAFTVLNPNPKILDKLAKSGKKVVIEGESVVGDNLMIRKLDGKNYKE